MPMGKGFAITSDLNLGRMLLAGYSKHVQNGFIDRDLPRNNTNGQNLPRLEIAAITNDTVATLASLAYSATTHSRSRVAMGLIVGTGTNSAIVWKLKDLHTAKCSSLVLPAQPNMDDISVVVNTEWTIKGAAPPLHRLNLITEWDKELDRQCEAPGFQPFEYMTSGRYLGEIARIILMDYFVNIANIDTIKLPCALKQRNEIPALFLSQVIAKVASPMDLLPILREKYPSPDKSAWDWSLQDARLFMAAADHLKVRSARMQAAAVVGLLASAGELTWRGDVFSGRLADKKQPVDEIIVAYAGGVISSYPGFLDTCQIAINYLVDQFTDCERVKRVTLRHANKGGIIGAGVLAGTVWNLPGP